MFTNLDSQPTFRVIMYHNIQNTSIREKPSKSEPKKAINLKENYLTASINRALIFKDLRLMFQGLIVSKFAASWAFLYFIRSGFRCIASPSGHCLVFSNVKRNTYCIEMYKWEMIRELRWKNNFFINRSCYKHCLCNRTLISMCIFW